MSEWLNGDGWRYFALSTVAFLVVAATLAAVAALFAVNETGVYLIGFATVVALDLCFARKHIFWPPTRTIERGSRGSGSHPHPRAGA